MSFTITISIYYTRDAYFRHIYKNLFRSILNLLRFYLFNSRHETFIENSKILQIYIDIIKSPNEHQIKKLLSQNSGVEPGVVLFFEAHLCEKIITTKKLQKSLNIMFNIKKIYLYKV